MAVEIKTGSIFIKEGISLPESLRSISEPYANGLRLVNGLDGCGLDRKIREAGWSPYYADGNVKASVLGFDQDEPKRRALERLAAKLKSDGIRFNSLEITRLTAKRFLGLPFVTLSAYYRDFQESTFLVHAKRVADWGRAAKAQNPREEAHPGIARDAGDNTRIAGPRKE